MLTRDEKDFGLIDDPGEVGYNALRFFFFITTILYQRYRPLDRARLSREIEFSIGLLRVLVGLKHAKQKTVKYRGPADHYSKERLV